MTISGTNINPDSLKSSSVNDMSEYHTADSSIKRNFMIAMPLVAIAAITVGSIYLKKGHPLTGRCLLVPSSTALGLAGATTIYHAIWDKNKSSSPTLSTSSSRIDWVKAPRGKNHALTFHSLGYYDALLASIRSVG